MLSSFFYSAFVEIADSDNISLAAEKLNYSQSGLSHAINRAESEFGFRLFKRTKYGVELTEEGNTLLPFARQVVFSMRKMDEIIASIQGLSLGHIKVGVYASISMNFLPTLLYRFMRENPGIQVELVEGTAHQIQQWIGDRYIDLALTSISSTDSFEKVPLFDDPLLAVFPKGIIPKLNADGRFPIEDFNNYNFIMPMMDKRIDFDIEQVIQERKLDLKMQVSSLDFITIMCMIREGLGVSLLPRLITFDYTDKLDFYETTPQAYRTLGIEFKSRDDISMATQKFIEYIKNYTVSTFMPSTLQHGFRLRL